MKTEKLILTYLTGNEEKFREAQGLLSGLERLKLDLPEIQSLDSREIIEAKLAVAVNIIPDLTKRVLLVEDVSFTFDTMGGLPGPMIKWFLKEIGAIGLYKMAQAFNAKKAFITITVGMALPEGKHEYFGVRVRGDVISPRGSTRFGFDPIFAPDGQGGRTFSQMSVEEKNLVSHRALVLKEVREYLEKKLAWKF